MGSTVVSHFHSSTIIFIDTATLHIVVVGRSTAVRSVTGNTSSGDNEETSSFQTSSLGSDFGGGTSGHNGTSRQLGTRSNSLRPDSMSRSIPMSPRSIKSHSQTSVAFTDSLGARRFPFIYVVNRVVKVVLTDDISLTVISRFLFVILESEGIFLFIGNTFSNSAIDSHGKLLFSTGVTEPKVLTGFVNQIDGSTFTSNKGVSTFGQAPATIEAIS